MSIHFSFKNNSYIVSNRNYTDDYSNISPLKIDMTMSGKYLVDYPKFNFKIKKFCEYPGHKEIKSLENNIKKNFNIRNSVIIGPGSNGILQNLVKILFKNGGNLVTPYLTFNQVEYAVSSLNCYTKRVYMTNNKIDLDKIYNSIDKETRMVYICNPNNPTGLIIDNIKIIELANKINCIVVVDESTIEFSNYKSLLEEITPNNLFIVRTFSKAYGLANLRVGYIVCNEQFEKQYKQNITINEVSGVSCIIAEKVFKSQKYKRNISMIKKEKEYLILKLKELEIDCYESESNIILTKTNFKKQIIDLMNKNGISILPIYDQDNKLLIRIAIQNHKTNRTFINILIKIRNEIEI